MNERDRQTDLDDVVVWAEWAGESKDTLSALRRIPLRLGSTALTPIPACLATIERGEVLGRVDKTLPLAALA